MTFDPDIHQRRLIRLRGHDYSTAGYYFVTVCVEGMEEILWRKDDVGAIPCNRPNQNNQSKI